MSELFTYIIKANIAIALFYLIYYFWLRNLTFYRVNRYFLLFSLVFSMLYPLVSQSWFQSTATLPSEVSVLPVWEYQYTTSQQISISTYLDRLFYLTVLVFGLRLCISLFGILRIHLSSKASIWNAYPYRKSEEDILPFSFWKNVYLNPSKHQEKELEGIFRHEYVHVRQLHSVDILLSEIVLIFCWYNPFAWLFRRIIKENIEFITDNNVLASGIDKQEYQYSLLTVLRGSQQLSLANYFNMKDLKKRISMMNKKQTSRFHMVKYMFLVPLVIGCLSIFTISEAKQRSVVPGSVINTIRNIGITKAGTGVMDTVIVDTVKTKKDTAEKITPIAKSSTDLKTNTTTERQDSSEVHIRLQAPDTPPLYVVDGKITSSLTLDPKDIKAVHVLKGESAILRYGEQGKNGVIEITKKKNEDVQPHQPDSTGTTDITAIKIDSVSYADYNSSSTIVYIDGARKKREDLSKIPVEEIKAINVYKAKEAKERFNAKPGQGVIVITTKTDKSTDTIK